MLEESISAIKAGETSLGIEFGSTRVKGVLINKNHEILASGSYEWKSKLENKHWTYDLSEALSALQHVYREIAEYVKKNYEVTLITLGAIGISGMMHGYIPIDQAGQLLTPFRTWQNTSTKEAAEVLTSLFEVNIPQRWSIAHVYQAILDEEEHVNAIDYLTTLAGYIHFLLTNEKVLGVGEASGMFPIDSESINYEEKSMYQFNQLIAEDNLEWRIEDILPKVLKAGEFAGTLTEKGAQLLDPSGSLEAGIPFAPPEGDAGTGMVATNSITEKTGNVSAGTSVFAMVVLEKELQNLHIEIDPVTTPNGKPVAMIHCNNFTTELNNWVELFLELLNEMGSSVSKNELFEKLFQSTLSADEDLTSVITINYHAGEPITDLVEGRPLMIRRPNSNLKLANFMRAQLYSAFATLRIGLEILTTDEKIEIDSLIGHGGFFKTRDIGQQMLADIAQVPVSLMNTSEDGGPWGIAILANYLIFRNKNESLEDYLHNKVFSSVPVKTLNADEKGMKAFNAYLDVYRQALKVEKTAIDVMRD